MPGGDGLSEPGLTRGAPPGLHSALTWERGGFGVASRLVGFRSRSLINGLRRANRLHDTE